MEKLSRITIDHGDHQVPLEFFGELLAVYYHRKPIKIFGLCIRSGISSKIYRTRGWRYVFDIKGSVVNVFVLVDDMVNRFSHLPWFREMMRQAGKNIVNFIE